MNVNDEIYAKDNIQSSALNPKSNTADDQVIELYFFQIEKSNSFNFEIFCDVATGKKAHLNFILCILMSFGILPSGGHFAP